MESGSDLRRSREGEMLIRSAGFSGNVLGGVRLVAQAKTSCLARCETAAFPHIALSCRCSFVSRRESIGWLSSLGC